MMEYMEREGGRESHRMLMPLHPVLIVRAPVLPPAQILGFRLSAGLGVYG